MRKLMVVLVVLVAVAIFAPAAGAAPSNLEEKVGALLEEPTPFLLPSGATQAEGDMFWLLVFVLAAGGGVVVFLVGGLNIFSRICPVKNHRV